MNQVESADRLDLNSVNSALELNLRPVIAWSAPANAFISASGNAVVVAHNLGRVPNDISVIPMQDGAWWVEETDRKLWTDKVIVFHGYYGRYVVKAGVQ